jgi:hypothetical protein
MCDLVLVQLWPCDGLLLLLLLLLLMLLLLLVLLLQGFCSYQQC